MKAAILYHTGQPLVVEEGMTVLEVARDLGINRNSLTRWKAELQALASIQARSHSGYAHAGLPSTCR